MAFCKAFGIHSSRAYTIIRLCFTVSLANVPFSPDQFPFLFPFFQMVNHSSGPESQPTHLFHFNSIFIIFLKLILIKNLSLHKSHFLTKRPFLILLKWRSFLPFHAFSIDQFQLLLSYSPYFSIPSNNDDVSSFFLVPPCSFLC
jgi:hypothetical protein